MNLILLQKSLNTSFDSYHRDYYLNETHILYESLTHSTRAITWVPLFNALLETVE